MNGAQRVGVPYIPLYLSAVFKEGTPDLGELRVFGFPLYQGFLHGSQLL